MGAHLFSRGTVSRTFVTNPARVILRIGPAVLSSALLALVAGGPLAPAQAEFFCQNGQLYTLKSNPPGQNLRVPCNAAATTQLARNTLNWWQPLQGGGTPFAIGLSLFSFGGPPPPAPDDDDENLIGGGDPADEAPPEERPDESVKKSAPAKTLSNAEAASELKRQRERLFNALSALDGNVDPSNPLSRRLNRSH
ncbi:MAG: hypothetical protein AAF441_22430, partial [Pseudomonadota bacterium]